MAESMEAKKGRVAKILTRLAKAYPTAGIELRFSTPLELLAATILSAQCTDERVNMVTEKLFKRYRRAADYAEARPATLEEEIHSTGFFKAKAKSLMGMGRALVERHGGEVPRTLDELVALPGVGRKTANLVLILSFKSLENICVDTHVHRISNRMGWVRTAQPEETEQALYKATDRRWWPLINLYLVTWGQNVCRPIYPRCGDCAIAGDCRRIGVDAR